MSERAACAALGWSRTSVRYQAVKPAAHPAEAVMLSVAREQPAWGYRRIHDAVRGRGIRVSRRLFLQLYNEPRPAHRRRKAAKRARRSGKPPERRATRPNEIWATDFMSDQLKTGMRIRLLVVVDEYTACCSLCA